MKRKLSITSNTLQISHIASLLLLFFLIQGVFVQAYIYDGPVVIVEPQSGSAHVGETFTVNVTIMTVQNLYGVGITLSWNSTILTVANVDVRLGKTGGVLYNSIFAIENSTYPDKYVLEATSQAPAPSFNGSGNIVKILFSVIHEGNTTLNLESQLWDHPPPDGVSSQIGHTIINGSFVATPKVTQNWDVLEFLRQNTIVIASLILIAGLASISFYILKYRKRKP